jgi:hypothetical protein
VVSVLVYGAVAVEEAEEEEGWEWAGADEQYIGLHTVHTVHTTHTVPEQEWRRAGRPFAHTLAVQHAGRGVGGGVGGGSEVGGRMLCRATTSATPLAVVGGLTADGKPPHNCTRNKTHAHSTHTPQYTHGT